MSDEEKEFSKKVNIDKAKIKNGTCITLSIISLITYIAPLMLGDFDFGIVFESLTFIFILIARYYMSKYDEEYSRKFTIFAMIPIGWLFIYDFITMLSYMPEMIILDNLGFSFIMQGGGMLLNLIILYVTIQDLKKAGDPEKYKESTDWFYERPDEKKENNKNL